MTTRGHEETDLQPKYVLYFAAALVVLFVVVFVGIWWIFTAFEQAQASREPRIGPVRVAAPVPEPRLQISPQGDLEELRRQEEEILTSYRWIDRDKGTARIPIDRAMELYLKRQAK